MISKLIELFCRLSAMNMVLMGKPFNLICRCGDSFNADVPSVENVRTYLPFFKKKSLVDAEKFEENTKTLESFSHLSWL